MYHSYRIKCITGILIAILFQLQTVWSQNIASVKGRVADPYGHPLQGVLINVKGSTASATSDAQGLFNINAAVGRALVFIHPNFNTEEVSVSNDQELFVRLSESYLPSLRNNINEDRSTKSNGIDGSNQQQLNVLYDQVSPSKYLGSISTIYNSQLRTTPASIYPYSFAGRLTGLNATQTQGFHTPQTGATTSVDIFVGNIPNNGGTGPTDNTEINLQLRGNGRQSPVTIIDGVQRDIYSLDPENIESVSVLKDALSSILLGVNSSRGVLLVTTKRPVAGSPRLSFTVETAVQSPLKLPKQLPSYQYAYLLNEALQNDGKAAIYSAADFNAYRNGTDPIGHPNVNWYDALLNKNPLLNRYNLNVTGGGNLARYGFTLSYMNQEGMFNTLGSNSYNTNAGLKRYIINSNLNIDVTKNFNVAVQLFGRIQEGTQPGAGINTVLNGLLNTPNNAYPISNPNQSYGGNSNYNQNLLGQSQGSGYQLENSRDVMANFDLKYKLDDWLPGLYAKAKANISVQSANDLNRSKQSPVFALSKSSSGDSVYTRYGSTVNQNNNFVTTSWARYWYAQASLGYERQFGDHNMNAMLFYDQRKTLYNYDLPATTTNYAIKAAYNYQGKYYAEGALTYGGYDRYEPGHQFGLFYAGGIGWDMAKENFIKDNVSWINQLKIRATYGKTGNANVDQYGYFIWRNYYRDMVPSYYMGTSYPNTAGLGEQAQLANINATWEKAHKADIGLDVSILKSHLQFTADYYHEKYYDLMQTRGRSITLIGLAYPAENIGINLYTGEEFTLTYQNNIKSFNYFLTGNVSVQQSKVVYMDEQVQKYSYNQQTGQPVGQRFGLTALGLFQTAAEAGSSATIPGYTPKAGDIKYKDWNSDGVIDQFDITPIGNTKPKIYYGLTVGFNYKGLGVSALIQGVSNRDVYVANATFQSGFQSQNNAYGQAYEQLMNRWTPETAATATYPRLTAGGNVNNQQPLFTGNSFWLHNGNYFRLKNVNVEYTLPYRWTRRFKVGGVKVFVNALNLFTHAGYDLVDPEVMPGSYPIQKVINTGINIKL